jgi:hypothetical protein
MERQGGRCAERISRGLEVDIWTPSFLLSIAGLFTQSVKILDSNFHFFCEGQNDSNAAPYDTRSHMIQRLFVMWVQGYGKPYLLAGFIQSGDLTIEASIDQLLATAVYIQFRGKIIVCAQEPR